jgi:hypothetical protein
MTFPVTYNEAELWQMHARVIERALPLISLPRTRVFPAGSIDLQIPTEAGHLFRLDAGHRSDLKPATIPI